MAGTDERSRIMGGALSLAALVAALLFLYGVLSGSYLALAIPVGAATLFVLGLVAWIGWTIATVQVPAEGEPLTAAGSGGAGAATRPEPGAPPPSEPPGR
jgi:hypothetical protein